MTRPLPILAMVTGVCLMLAGASFMQSGASGLDTLSGLVLAWAGLSCVVVVVVWPAIARRL